jgi:hypothetical protein
MISAEQTADTCTRSVVAVRRAAVCFALVTADEALAECTGVAVPASRPVR